MVKGVVKSRFKKCLECGLRGLPGINMVQRREECTITKSFRGRLTQHKTVVINYRHENCLDDVVGAS